MCGQCIETSPSDRMAVLIKGNIHIAFDKALVKYEKESLKNLS